MTENQKQIDVTHHRTKVVYVAGPYRDKRGAHYIDQNIQNARAVAAELWKLGFAVICPHLNTSHMDGLIPDDDFIEGLIAILLRCDAIVTMEDYQQSQGTLAELEQAYDHNIPVYYWPMVPPP